MLRGVVFMIIIKFMYHFKHKTTDNLELKKAFTLSFATKKTEKISDYFGVVSGNKEDKIEKVVSM